jgi:hypothetical protein
MPTTAPNAARLTPQIGARLGRLIVLLASPHDGEKVAACCAIVRTLAAAGLDLHALAEFVCSAAAGEAPTVPPVEDEDLSPREKATWCLEAGAATLTARERKFLEDIARMDYPPSARQSAWLEAILERVEAGCR